MDGYDIEVRSVATLKFESRTRVKEVEEELRRICPEGTRVTGFAGKKEDGGDVDSYMVVLLLPLNNSEAKGFLEGSKDREEMARHEEFKEFCREHVLDMEIDVIVGDNEGNNVLELAEMCRALRWMMMKNECDGEVLGFGDVWLVCVALGAAAKMIEKMEVGEDELTEEEDEEGGEEDEEGKKERRRKKWRI